jgi:hypothetical protein
MLSSFDIANTACIIVLLAIYSYVAYIGFGIRHTFSVGLYRRQALGIGFVALIFSILLLNNFVFSYIPPNKPTDIAHTNSGPAGVVIFFLFFLVLFYWIDVSVLAAKKSNPLLKDILYWRRVRVVLRPLIFLDGGLLIALFLAFLFSTILAGTFTIAGPQGSAPATLAIPFFIILFGVPISGMLLLPMSAWRTKDPLLRKQLFWFGLFAVIGFVNQLQTGFNTNAVEALFVTYALFFIAGYCLYRSAKSLVPLYSFSKDIPQQ